jgi:hypothetical protein
MQPHHRGYLLRLKHLVSLHRPRRCRKLWNPRSASVSPLGIPEGVSSTIRQGVSFSVRVTFRGCGLGRLDPPGCIEAGPAHVAVLVSAAACSCGSEEAGHADCRAEESTHRNPPGSAGSRNLQMPLCLVRTAPRAQACPIGVTDASSGIGLATRQDSEQTWRRTDQHRAHLIGDAIAHSRCLHGQQAYSQRLH